MHLEIRDDGDTTVVSLGSRDPGQRQSQGNGFTTGKWVKPATVVRVEDDVVIRIETADGPRFIRVQGRQIRLLDGEPDLTGGKEITLTKSTDETSWKPMEPMKPMKPMAPMRPMRAMK